MNSSSHRESGRPISLACLQGTWHWVVLPWVSGPAQDWSKGRWSYLGFFAWVLLGIFFFFPYELPWCLRPAMQEIAFNPWVRKIPWRKEWLPTPVFLLGEFHWQRSLVGYSPWGHRESDMTKWLTHSLFFFPHGEMVHCPIVHGTCYFAALMGLFARTCDALWCGCIYARLFSRVWLLATLQTVVLQAPLSTGFFQTRILECIASSSFRGSSRPWDQACISCITCTAGRVFTAELLGKPLVVDICTLKVHWMRMKWCQTSFLKIKAPKQDFLSHLILWLSKLKSCKQDQKFFFFFPENENGDGKRRGGDGSERRVKDKEINICLF